MPFVGSTQSGVESVTEKDYTAVKSACRASAGVGSFLGALPAGKAHGTTVVAGCRAIMDFASWVTRKASIGRSLSVTPGPIELSRNPTGPALPVSPLNSARRSGVSLMLGRRGGRVVSDAALDQLERGLLSNRITLIRNADNLLSSKNAGGLLRVYRDGSASLFLRKNPTRYEVLHESQHIEHLRQIGAKRYIELSKTKAGNLELEQFVYDNLRRHHWSSLTPDEIKHSQWYICDVLGGNAW